MKKNIDDWTEAECFLFGALIASGRHFFQGEGGTGKKFQYYQSLDGGTASIVTEPVQEEYKD